MGAYRSTRPRPRNNVNVPSRRRWMPNVLRPRLPVRDDKSVFPQSGMLFLVKMRRRHKPPVDLSICLISTFLHPTSPSRHRSVGKGVHVDFRNQKNNEMEFMPTILPLWHLFVHLRCTHRVAKRWITRMFWYYSYCHFKRERQLNGPL